MAIDVAPCSRQELPCLFFLPDLTRAPFFPAARAITALEPQHHEHYNTEVLYLAFLCAVRSWWSLAGLGTFFCWSSVAPRATKDGKSAASRPCTEASSEALQTMALTQRLRTTLYATSHYSTPSRLAMTIRPPLPSIGPIHWILDWDGTITRHDTLNALVHISASTKPTFPTLDHWKRVTQAYLDDYTATIEKLVPDGRLPTTVAEEKELLANLKAVEQRSLNRVSASGIFAGLTSQQLDQGAKKAVDSQQVELRAGYLSFFQRIQARQDAQGDQLSFLSVNWSRCFIASCLRAAGAEVPLDSIISNELEGIDKGKASTGHIQPCRDMEVISSGDKLQWLNRLRESNSSPGQPMSIVYVGDSWTDIECLLTADLGICIRDDPMGSSQKKLAGELQRLSIRCPHLTEWVENQRTSIVWAKDFKEIEEWLSSGLL